MPISGKLRLTGGFPEEVVFSKSKKLFVISEVIDIDGAGFVDPDAASRHILQSFEDKWDCKNAERFQRILDLPADFPELDFENMGLTFDDIDMSFRCMKRLSRVDSHGVSREALYMFFDNNQTDSLLGSDAISLQYKICVDLLVWRALMARSQQAPEAETYG